MWLAKNRLFNPVSICGSRWGIYARLCFSHTAGKQFWPLSPGQTRASVDGKRERSTDGVMTSLDRAGATRFGACAMPPPRMCPPFFKLSTTIDGNFYIS